MQQVIVPKLVGYEENSKFRYDGSSHTAI